MREFWRRLTKLDVEQKANNNWQIVTYAVNISEKGKLLIDAWQQGDRTRLSQVLGGPVPGADASGALSAAKSENGR
jgi:hypothetical protein